MNCRASMVAVTEGSMTFSQMSADVERLDDETLKRNYCVEVDLMIESQFCSMLVQDVEILNLLNIMLILFIDVHLISLPTNIGWTNLIQCS